MTGTINKLTFQLQAITALLQQIDPFDYTLPIPEMGNATIGKHVRHTLEVIQSAVNGYLSEKIDYEIRERNPEIESAPGYAGKTCNEIIALISRPDKPLMLIEYDENGDPISIASNYGRELLFVLDHTIHHMALIKTGLQILKKDSTDTDFGVAYSTIQYRLKSCAQ